MTNSPKKIDLTLGSFKALTTHVVDSATLSAMWANEGAIEMKEVLDRLFIFTYIQWRYFKDLPMGNKGQVK